ncbi:MAG: WD40 repeat domain-containing protein [Planctomycetaceae bacterium]|nr:WD40 repeat domain-containing protein [Planctomycetaceae bacterium]
MAGLLSSDNDGPTVLIHDVKANRPYSSSRWQKREVLCIAASSDGRQLASQDTDKTIKLLGVAEGALKVLGTISNESRYHRVNLRFTNNDAQLWHFDEHGFSLWDADSREKIHQQGLACAEGKLDISPDSGLLLLTNRYSQKVPMLLDTAPVLRFKKPTRSTRIFDDAHSNEIRNIIPGDDSKSLVLLRDNDGLAVVDSTKQRQTAWLPFYGSGSGINRESVGVTSSLALYYQNESEYMLYRRTLPDGKPVPILRLPEGKSVRSAVASSSGTFVAIQIPDRTIVLDSTNSVIHQGTYPGTLTAISDDGKWMATQDSYTVTIVDVDAKSVLGSWDAKYASAWSSDATCLIGRGGEEGSLWKLIRDTGEVREDFPLHRHNSSRVGQIQAIAVAAKSPYLAAAGQQLIRIYNHQTNRMLGVLRGHSKEVLSVAISPDGNTVYSGDEGGHLLTWDLTAWVNEDSDDDAGVSAETSTETTWNAEPRTYASKSGVRITIETTDDTTSATVAEALRDVLREIQQVK